MKVLVGTFNQEKALVGAFSVMVITGYGTDGSICGTNILLYWDHVTITRYMVWLMDGGAGNTE